VLPATANLASETRQMIGILQARPQHQATSLSENEAARADNAALRGATLGATPLVVLAAGQTIQYVPNWRESQVYQAGLSTNSRLIVADDSDHSIHWDRPALVIDAVRTLIEAADTGQSLVR
jgi:pimeloyl-ACP methyl ester carboxylesterase